MSVGNILNKLREGTTWADIAQKTHLSRETVRRIKCGEAAKLSTIRVVADYLKASEDQWAELVCAWLQEEAGADAGLVVIRPSKKQRERVDPKFSEAAAAFAALPALDQDSVLNAMQRPDVLQSIRSINKIYDKFAQ